MKKFMAVLLMLMLILLPASAFASVGVKQNGSYIGEATDIDFSSLSFDGSTATVNYASNLFASGRIGASSSLSSSSTKLVPANIPYTVLRKVLSAGAESTTLQNGTAGQILQLIVVESSGGVWTITPTTALGWSSLTMTASGAFITLMYLNDSFGWILLGQNGATITSTRAV